MRGRRESSQFQCIACKQAFSRLEHLTRHSRSHLSERSYKCNVCQKGFYRIDALRRHEQIHNEEQNSSRLNKGDRACQACAVGRRKCSEGRTCEACQRRGIQCIRLKRSRPQSGSNERADIQEVTESSSPSRSEYSSRESEDMRHNASTTSPIPMHSGEELQQCLLVSSENEMRVSNVGTTAKELPPATQKQSQPLEKNLWVATSLPDAWLRSSMSTMNWVFDHQITEAPNSTANRTELSNHRAFGNTPPGLPQLAMNNVLDVPPASSPQQNWQMISDAGASNVNSPLQTGWDSASQNTQGTSGRYYVDGDGARLPHVKRRCIETELSPTRPVQQAPSCPMDLLKDMFALPNIDFKLDVTQENYSPISELIHDHMADSYIRLCVSSSIFPPFGDGMFPSRSSVSHLVQLYFEFFHPIMPFLHAPTFNVSQTHWLLLLAMAAVGSHYTNPLDREFIGALHELVRRNIITFENIRGKYLDEITMLQIKLLNIVGLRYCGNPQFASMLMSHSLNLALFCNFEWERMLNAEDSCENHYREPERAWMNWCKAESLCRTGYCIWLLDCMGSFHFQQSPLLSLDIANVPLPCQEVLWEAGSAMDWQQLFSCAAPSPRLATALQHLYIEKRLQPSLGEFSRIILIHALFHRTWEVQRFFKQPFALWTPTAEKEDSIVYERGLPTFLPRYPMYAKWRNSACDCLDILHWHANSVIGAAAGMEHSTVLHLHLARIVLLVPIREITILVENISSAEYPRAEIARLSDEIRRWAVEDHFKARLAIIHAGVTLWHVRRYSADSFYEPWSVWLATLTLWAYSTFGKHPLDNGPSDTTESDLFQATIQLDRPADDELVQLFVKGETMKANITGVGNIHSSTSPLRVLREGEKLLQGLAHWDLHNSRIESLTNLMSHIVRNGD